MNEENEPSKSSYRWMVLALSWFIYFSLGCLLGALPPLVTPISNDLALTYSQMGLVLGSSVWMYVALSIPIGVIIDKFALKRMISVGILLIAISSLLRYFAFDFITLFLAVFLQGCGGPIISVGLSKSIASTFQSDERGLALGIYMTGIIFGNASALTITNSVLIPR